MKLITFIKKFQRAYVEPKRLDNLTNELTDVLVCLCSVNGIFISKGEKQLRGGLSQTTRLRWKNSIGFGLKMRQLSKS
jgi:hypothetical protein